ncbi:MAG: alpha/beta hydrolase [Pseudomonadota bacterium]
MTAGAPRPPDPGGAPAPLDRAPPTDWDDAYANSAHVPEAPEIIARWERDAPAFRDALGPRARSGLPYPGPLNDAERERFDLFLPEGEPKGLTVFIHGGYWMGYHPSLWSSLAAGPLARGWAVAMPSYTLAPAARIGDIVRQIAAFLDAAAQQVPGPIRLSGHSAGGHLAARMVCGAAPEALLPRIERTVSISGVHDLRPIRRTALNDTLKIDAAEALAESPALLTPVEGARVTAWTGAAERPEFVRQAELLANVWVGLGAATRLVLDPGRNHFDVIDALADPASPLVAELCGDPGP